MMRNLPGLAVGAAHVSAVTSVLVVPNDDTSHTLDHNRKDA
jgi:hypothetical protein